MVIMKKWISILLVFVSLIWMTGCTLYMTDDEIADENMNLLIECLDARDKEQIKKLFAPSIVAQIDTFDESIEELLEYYQGTYISLDRHAVGTTDSKDGNHVRKELDMSFDVLTTENKYRIGILWQVKDTLYKDNIGITSLYILEFSKDPYPNYAYRSGGEIGINVDAYLKGKDT